MRGNLFQADGSWTFEWGLYRKANQGESTAIEVFITHAKTQVSPVFIEKSEQVFQKTLSQTIALAQAGRGEMTTPSRGSGLAISSGGKKRPEVSCAPVSERETPGPSRTIQEPDLPV
jgi:hypothetical protein